MQGESLKSTTNRLFIPYFVLDWIILQWHFQGLDRSGQKKRNKCWSPGLLGTPEWPYLVQMATTWSEACELKAFEIWLPQLLPKWSAWDVLDWLQHPRQQMMTLAEAG